MLTSVIVVAPPGAYWPDLEIKLVPDAGANLVLLDVPSGLEPVAATVSSRPYGELDGEFHTGSKVGKRNIVLKLGLLTPAARDLFYAYFLPKNLIKLRLNFDNRDYVEINGIVENNTPAGRFTESPELPTMQVSIICPHPNFHSVFKTVTGVMGVESDLLYLGTTGGGFSFEMEVGEDPFAGDFQLTTYIDGTTNYKTMQFNNISIAGSWKIFISTYLGRKKAEFRPPDLLVDLENPITMLGYMQDTYFWNQFYAGAHKILVTTIGSDDPREWTLSYTDQYAGV